MAEEVWEMQTGGRVWVETTLDKSRGTTKMKSVKGKGSRLRIDVEDRKLAQERVRDPRHDPFTNGLLVRIDANQQEEETTKSESAKTDEELLAVFKVKAQAKFRAALEDFTEIALRRLVHLAEENSDTVTANQLAIVKETCEAKFGVNRGKTPIDGGAEQIAATFPVQKLSS
jgi:hypothetical protein